MPEEILSNPAVNPVVDTDGSSNLQGRRYNSTTDDLLDRIRQAVEGISGGGGGGGSASNTIVQVADFWLIYTGDAVLGSEFVRAGLIFINTLTNQITEIKHHNGSSVNLTNTILSFSPTIFTSTGRLDSSVATDEVFYLQNPVSGAINFNIPACANISIPLNNVLEIDILVLPESILSEDIEENYFEIIQAGIFRRYYVESFNGIAPISHLHFEFKPNDQSPNFEILSKDNIKLEYIIKSTYPYL